MKSRPEREFAVAFLAKGKSARMEKVKALLPFDGRTILDCLVSEFAGGSDDRVPPAESSMPVPARAAVVTSEPQSFSGVRIELLIDYVHMPGPVGAIYTALAHFHPLDVLVIPADMPFLRRTLVHPLMAALRGKQCAVFRTGSEIEHFPCLLSPSAINPVAAALREKRFRMVDLLDSLDKSTVSFGESLPGEKPEEFLMNINTHEDYLAALSGLECRPQTGISE